MESIESKAGIGIDRTLTVMLAVRMQDKCFIMVDLLLEYIFKNCITFIRFFIFCIFCLH